MKYAKQTEIARKSVLLSSLPENVVEDLIKASSFRHFSRGETVFLQGDPASSIHIITDGWVKLFRIAHSGAESVVHVLTRGHSFGEAVAFRRRAYPVSAEAVTDCLLLEVPASALVSFMETRPDICISLLAATFQHLHELVTHVEQLKAHTGAQRVADFLLDLAECDANSCIVTLPYDKVLIAGRLGMKPESLSRAFGKLKKVGVTIERNHAAIGNLQALRDYAEEDTAAAWSKAH
ncbi:MAG: Crp/Fnr family transcriptional regulator [Rhodobacteraceae bacterium]|nr:Crp/Fnr family transcriptional regulator [Paracoccaceae bacterium]